MNALTDVRMNTWMDALSACEGTVTACAVGMTADHGNTPMASAITLGLDCGDVALATRRVLTRRQARTPVCSPRSWRRA